MRRIIKTPDPILRRVSKPVGAIDAHILELASDINTVLSRENNAGLAAVQLGELVRMIGIQYNDEPLIIINPVIDKRRFTFVGNEACISVGRNKLYAVKRNKIVRVRGISIEGEPISIKTRDLLAMVIQHEVDHLDGIMIDKKGVKLG